MASEGLGAGIAEQVVCVFVDLVSVQGELCTFY